jgi:hypothetical protein
MRELLDLALQVLAWRERSMSTMLERLQQLVDGKLPRPPIADRIGFRLTAGHSVIRSLCVNRSGVAERQNALQALGLMATNLNPISPDALLKIVEQVKEYYVEPPPQTPPGPSAYLLRLGLPAAGSSGGGAADV